MTTTYLQSVYQNETTSIELVIKMGERTFLKILRQPGFLHEPTNNKCALIILIKQVFFKSF